MAVSTTKCWNRVSGQDLLWLTSPRCWWISDHLKMPQSKCSTLDYIKYLMCLNTPMLDHLQCLCLNIPCWTTSNVLTAPNWTTSNIYVKALHTEPQMSKCSSNICIYTLPKLHKSKTCLNVSGPCKKNISKHNHTGPHQMSAFLRNTTC